jgi:hypothetical protein
MMIGAVVAVVGLLAGAAGSRALEDWRAESAARGTPHIVAVLSGTEAEPGSRALSANFTILNSGLQPVTVEGVILDGWPRLHEPGRSPEIGPGDTAIVTEVFTVDCADASRQPRRVRSATIDLRTVDGARRTVEAPLLHWFNLGETRGWMCAPHDEENVWAEFGTPVARDDGTLTLAMDVHSEPEVTVVGVAPVGLAFTVETTQLPVTTKRDSGASVATVWRVRDCAAAQRFDRVSVQLTLDDGSHHFVEIWEGSAVALVRFAERSCPA